VVERVFDLREWATLQPAGGWEVGAGKFTTGPASDLLGYQSGDGSLWVGRNDGDRFSFSTPWGRVEPAAGWQFVTGDLTGGGRDDVVGYHSSNGSVWVGQNRGQAFDFTRWATLDPASGWRIGTGFFAQNARADLLCYHGGTGTLWVGENTGSEFTLTGVWATVDPAGGWQFATGDFTGNGRTDVVGYLAGDGSVWVGENGGSTFEFTRSTTLAPAAGWHIAAGHFTGRDRADLLCYHSGTGTVWIGANLDPGFAFSEASATLAPAAGWQVVPASTNGDVWDDAVAYHPSSGTVVVGESTVRPMEGFCWPLSAAPGEAISFHVSGEGESGAVFQRHISTSRAVEATVAGSASFTAARQATSESPWRSGAGWSESFRLTVPSDWPSGIYSAACTDAAATRCDITFVVKPAATQRTEIAVLANVNTWLAYNGWGGQSKYSGAARTSFLRPMPAAGPGGDMHLTRGELWILGWLESQGHRPDVYTDIDFHDHGCDPEQYPILIFGTHPEYWTLGMLDQLATYLDAGGSVAYLGGNGVFEAGEYSDDRTEMVFRRGVEGGAREDALLRVLDRHERSILGVATERCSVIGSPYVVQAADHDLFAGTGVSNGDRFGDFGLNTGFGNGKASAWEVDTSTGPGAVGMPSGCLLSPAAVPPSTLPGGLVVLATGLPDDAGPGADMTCYDHPGGGFVFSAGSLTFGGSLVVDPVISTLMHNVLERAGIP
jgi:hypothetical protein